jgi:hypothetical protein
MKEKDDIDKWLKFFDPESLKENLMFSSLYIALFESFKDYVVDAVKFFFNTGFSDDEYTFSEEYDNNVKILDKSPLKATLLWLKDLEAIDEKDIDIYDELRQYRNKLSHELMNLLFEGLPKELPQKYAQLIALRIKIEKWWIINIDIPTNPDYDSSTEIEEEDITTGSQIFNQLIFDMLSGDEKRASFYQNEFKKRFEK